MPPTVYLSVGALYGVTHRMLCALVLPEAQRVVGCHSCRCSPLGNTFTKSCGEHDRGGADRRRVTGGNAAGGLGLRGKASTWRGKEDLKSHARKMSNRVLFSRWAIGFNFLLVQLSQSRVAKHRFRQTQPLTNYMNWGKLLNPSDLQFPPWKMKIIHLIQIKEVRTVTSTWRW